MCRLSLVLATLLMMPIGASLDGQTTRPRESELVARIDSLSEILDRANSVAKVADAVRSEERRRLLSGQIDTLQVGPFLVVTPVGQVRLARRHFERAWARYAAIVGTERTAIDGRVFLYGKNELLYGLDSRGSTRVTTRYLPRNRLRAIGRILGGVMSADLPDDLRTWVGSFYIEADPTPELAWAYRSLTTTASASVSDCYDGTLERCWDAMGHDHQDSWATSWYTASERRELVRRLNTSGVVGARASCLEDQRDDACMALLVDQDAAAGIPLPPGTRMTLLAHALSLGGPQGYKQMAADTDASIKDRLVRISGVSADSLISSWRTEVFQGRPDAREDTRRLRWSSLFWFLVLAGVSTRSTRWRLT